MHETSHNDIKGFVDDIKYDGSTLMVIGWAFHDVSKQVYPLRIVSGQHTVVVPRVDRNDVSNYYKLQSITYCGFNFSMKFEHVVTLQMNIDNQWIPFFTFEKPKEQTDSPLITSQSAAASPLITSVEAATKVEVIQSDFTPKTKHTIPTVLVVDDFYESPNEVRKFALSCNFKEHKEYHKGRRTDECYRFPGLKEHFEQLLNRKIKNWNHYGTNGCFQYCVAGDQLVYHNDNQQYAGIVYLSPNAPPQSGTSLYRSRYTKKMKVTQEESNLVFRNGYLDSTEFDMVDTIGNVYNRLILFDSQCIHAATTYYGTTKENSRLFQLFFFDLE